MERLNASVSAECAVERAAPVYFYFGVVPVQGFLLTIGNAMGDAKKTKDDRRKSGEPIDETAAWKQLAQLDNRTLKTTASDAGYTLKRFALNILHLSATSELQVCPSVSSKVLKTESWRRNG
jgi:hypothetical protein